MSSLYDDEKEKPQFLFDCRNCKFNWNCGPACSCVFSVAVLPDPPDWRKQEVNLARINAGFEPEFDDV